MFETYYILIGNEMVPVQLMISTEPETIDGKEWYLVQHKSGFKKGLTKEGIDAMKTNSSLYEKFLSKNLVVNS